jgi:hypothetical protein
MLTQQRALRGGLALRAACGDASTASECLGVSERLARDWFNGGDGSPVSRSLELLDSVPDPAPLITEHKIALHRKLLTMNPDQLVAEFFEVLERATAAEAAQLQEKVRCAQLRDLNALREASSREATLDEKLAAICDRLEELRINPWQYQEARRS